MKQDVDVIALHKKDGSIVPLRIRLIDEEGVAREFTIKQYRDVSGQGAREMPDGMYISNSFLAYECYIEVAGVRRLVRLYYRYGNAWIMTDVGW
ncbi:MAG: hypothetical protein IKN07_00385 [Lachnospiraceae bacterium]|nr:hypothetical protein [Lachnospiraceae bacterium]MBR3734314.1 hypothetical protein [Lachnospiraceae bacterium]